MTTPDGKHLDLGTPAYLQSISTSKNNSVYKKSAPTAAFTTDSD